MNTLTLNIIRYGVGILLGGTLGYIYFSTIGCQSGGCIITSDPIVTILYFGVLGGFFASLFKKKKQDAGSPDGDSGGNRSGSDKRTKKNPVVEVNTANFKEEVLDYKGIVIVDFWASWCAPCRMLSPLIKEIAKENLDRVKVAALNTEENQQLAGQFGIQSIPTVMYFKNGERVENLVGIQDKNSYMSLIDKHEASL